MGPLVGGTARPPLGSALKTTRRWFLWFGPQNIGAFLAGTGGTIWHYRKVCFDASWTITPLGLGDLVLIILPRGKLKMCNSPINNERLIHLALSL
jgi:hypothetical protein